MQHLIGGHRQPVRLLELRVQALGKTRMRLQHSAPGTLDDLRSVPVAADLPLGGLDLDGGRGWHNVLTLDPAQSNIAACKRASPHWPFIAALPATPTTSSTA